MGKERKYNSELAQKIAEMPGGAEMLDSVIITVVGAASDEDRRNFKFVTNVPKSLADIVEFSWDKYHKKICTAIVNWLKSQGHEDVPQEYQDILSVIQEDYDTRKREWERKEKIRKAGIHMPLKTGLLDWYLENGGSVEKLAGVEPREKPQPKYESRFGKPHFAVDPRTMGLKNTVQFTETGTDNLRGEDNAMRFMNNKKFDPSVSQPVKSNIPTPSVVVKPKQIQNVMPSQSAKVAIPSVVVDPVAEQKKIADQAEREARMHMTGRPGILPEIDEIEGDRPRFNSKEFIKQLNEKARASRAAASASNTVVTGTVVEPTVDTDTSVATPVVQSEAVDKQELADALARATASEVENKQLHLKLGQSQAENSVLKLEIDKNSDYRAILNSVLEVGDKAILDLLAIKETYEARFETCKEESIEKDNRIAKQAAELSLLRAKHAAPAANAEELAKLRTENAELKKANERLTTDREEALDMCEQEVETKDTEIARLREFLAKSQAENEALKAENEQLKATASVASGDFATNERVDAIDSKLDRVIGLLEKQSAPVVDLTQLTTVVGQMADTINGMTIAQQQPVFDVEKFAEVQANMIDKVMKHNAAQMAQALTAMASMTNSVADITRALAHGVEAENAAAESAAEESAPTPVADTPADAVETEIVSEPVKETVGESDVEETAEVVTSSKNDTVNTVAYTIDGPTTEAVEVEVLDSDDTDTCETTVTQSSVEDTVDEELKIPAVEIDGWNSADAAKSVLEFTQKWL